MNKLLGLIFAVVAFAVLSNVMILAGLLTFATPAGVVAALVVFFMAQ